MANDIDLWQDLQKQEKFIKWLKVECKKDPTTIDTLKRAKENYKMMSDKYYNTYIATI